MAHSRGTIDDTCMQTDAQIDSWMMKMSQAQMGGWMIGWVFVCRDARMDAGMDEWMHG